MEFRRKRPVHVLPATVGNAEHGERELTDITFTIQGVWPDRALTFLQGARSSRGICSGKTINQV